jgi:SPP1 gp7 family putative phage head morphogenesis protein
MAKPDLSLAIGLPPKEAIAYFEAKGLKLSGDWRELWKEQHAKAFTVAHLAKMDVLQDIRDALSRALQEGRTEYDFVKELTPLLQKKGWWGPAIDKETGEILETYEGTSVPVQWGSPRRLKLIYRQNLQTAYQVGRHQQQRALADLKGPGARPYWQYVAVNDSRTRPAHSALHGTIYHANDPAWDAIYPPNGWNCRCRVRALTQRQVDKLGIDVTPAQLETVEVAAGRLADGSPDLRPVTGVLYRDPKTGKDKIMLPDAGWDYNPGKAGDAWRGLIEAARAKVSTYEAAVGAASQAELRDLAHRDWQEWLPKVMAGEERDRLGWLGVLGVRDLALLKDAGIDPVSAEIMVRPGLVKGPKATRHERAGDALSQEQWQALPELFEQSTALLVDTQSGKPIWLLPGSDERAPQLAVAIDFMDKTKQAVNAVVSAYLADVNALRGREDSGQVRVLRGRIE